MKCEQLSLDFSKPVNNRNAETRAMFEKYRKRRLEGTLLGGQLRKKTNGWKAKR